MLFTRKKDKARKRQDRKGIMGVFGIDVDGILYIWVDIITCGHLDHVIVARKHLELEQLSVDVNVLLLWSHSFLCCFNLKLLFHHIFSNVKVWTCLKLSAFNFFLKVRARSQLTGVPCVTYISSIKLNKTKWKPIATIPHMTSTEITSTYIYMSKMILLLLSNISNTFPTLNPSICPFSWDKAPRRISSYL